MLKILDHHIHTAEGPTITQAESNVLIQFWGGNGFQKFEKIKDPSRQSRQLEELTGKMRECKRLIKEFDREVKDLEHTISPDNSKILNEKIQSMVKELNSYVALKKQYASNIENKRVDLFGGPAEGFEEDNGLLASCKTFLQ
ncbi:hypothetical protein L2E82_18555 [Cichorium intybus]|uniref:Uncharacterized protein n=1 Tax=Cichorium intybus TaxID=13427 RepID=A0ACB9FBG1_CICIN|nr:hypothetical protein L2E82_18555 [Cichorium intybus]